MRLSVPTNFDPELIPRIAPYPVFEVYGKLPQDALGGGRLSQVLPDVSLSGIRRHAELCRKHGIRFNYLLNAAASDNLEFTRAGQRKIERLIGRLADSGIEDFTVATPYLLRYLKSRYPRARVKISVFAQVGDIRKARHWEEQGADEIVLDSMLVNRDFERLRDIRPALRIPLQLLVNNNCLYGCSLSPYHMNVLASGSRAGNRTSGILPDYCFLSCTADRLRRPVNYLIADWVRPEDLHHYEALGYENFKLAGRNVATAVIVKRVRAYHERRYEGNLLDLVQDFGQPGENPVRPGPFRMFRNLARWILWSSPGRAASWRKMWDLARHRGFFAAPAKGIPVSVNNRALDGFLEPIIRMGSCRDRVCEECRYCHRAAERAVSLNEPVRDLILRDQEPLLREIETGSYWRGPANGMEP